MIRRTTGPDVRPTHDRGSSPVGVGCALALPGPFEPCRGPSRCRLATVVAEDPQAAANGYLYEVEHPEHGRINVIGCPIRFSETPARRSIRSPELGEHTAEILRELGAPSDPDGAGS